MAGVTAADSRSAVDGVRAYREGRAGRIVLDRPAALNALDLAMVRAVAAALATFRDDPKVHAVTIASASPRAFCAGGDIRAVRSHALAGETAAIEDFFREEYALNLAIATFAKPWIALIDGACMGGGIGLSVHGAARVATERAVFAMPETAIALFPDIGASYILPRLPGELGAFLALTGTRMQGADAVHAGFATHYVPSDALAGLSDAIARDGAPAVGVQAREVPPFSLAPHRKAIDHAFGADSVPDIVARLAAMADTPDGDWASTTLDTLRRMSPSSLVWSFLLLRAGTGRTLAECLAAELRLTRTVTRHPDFAEGVRAMVVDKDRTPRWSPPRIEDVDTQAIAAMLA